MVQSYVNELGLTLPSLAAAGMLCSLLMALKFGYRVYRRIDYLGSKSHALSMLAVLCLAVGLVALWQGIWLGFSTSSLLVWSSLGGAGLVGAVWYTFGKPNHHQSTRLTLGLALLATLEFGGFFLGSQHLADPESFEDRLIDVQLPGDLLEVPNIYASTQSGATVKLYQRTVSREEFASFVDGAASTIQGFTQTAILRAEADKSANCHGWVFTNGQYIIACEDVDTILHGNNYTEVQRPQLGDVAVYRNSDRAVVHTGVVRGFLDNEIPLVESKWGMNGVYLHLANQQPYSSTVSYWRSASGDRALDIRSRSDDIVVEELVDARPARDGSHVSLF